MVSYGPDVESYNFTHMYSFVDYRPAREPEVCINKNSTYAVIHGNPAFSIFDGIVRKANMIGTLNDIQGYFTVFVPTDTSLSHIPKDYFQTMDIGLAKQIVKACCIQGCIDKYLLTSSPVAYYYTMNPDMRMYITNIGGVTRLNNCAKVVKYDMKTCNGMVHVIDGFIAPNMDHFMN